jgi:hypothetical protein
MLSMIEKSLKSVSFILIIFLVQCSTSRKPSATGKTGHIQATITREGLITCFESGLSANGLPVWCESSAILYDGKNLLLANDKDMPDKRSSVFLWPFRDGFADTTWSVEYLTNPVLKNGKKFEDFALSPNSKYVFLTTGFDRVKPGSTEWNSYNTLFYWKTGDEKHPKILRKKLTDSTSVFLRDRISSALSSFSFPNAMPYFKLEGLAATNNRLYFGVREEGKKFDDFTYKIKIISIPYSFRKGELELGREFTVVSDFNSTEALPSQTFPMGISSIEYDHYNNRFLLLTSFENGENLGGYLWTASLSDLKNNNLHLVRDERGEPLVFNHKPEDIAIINKNRVIIIHDDDRVKTSVSGKVRQPNQAAFSIVEFR